MERRAHMVGHKGATYIKKTYSFQTIYLEALLASLIIDTHKQRGVEFLMFLEHTPMLIC